MNEDGGTLDIHIPMEFQRRSGRKEIVLPPDANTTPDFGPQRPIVLALARAYKWQQMLDSGEARSLDELAERHNIDRSYVSRMLKLTSLAPDIVQAMLAGDEPTGLSLAKLRQGLPFWWDEQRELLGFDRILPDFPYQNHRSCTIQCS